MSYSAPLVVSSFAADERLWQHEPVTVGVPLPRGAVTDAATLTLRDSAGRFAPLDATPLERWPDGSLRWVLLDSIVTGRFEAERQFVLEAGGTTDGTDVAPITIERVGDGLAVDTGVARAVVAPGQAFPFVSLSTTEGRCPFEARESRLLITMIEGQRDMVRFDDVRVVHAGRLRVAIALTGSVGPPRHPWLRVRAELQFWAGSASPRVAITLHNPRRARHRGGIWELGDDGAVHLREACLRLPLPAGASAAACALEAGGPLTSVDLPLELYQDSSGGAKWDDVSHVNRHGEVPATFRGYRLTAGNATTHGLRATPCLGVSHAGGDIGIAVEHFWQHCPAALGANEDALTFQFFPPQYADCHELQGGERKTFRCVLLVGDGAATRDARFWAVAPAVAHLTPAAYGAADALPFIAPASADSDPRYQHLVSAALDGPDAFVQKRETIDQYGWRDFGDVYADHEAVFSGCDGPIVSHYNNQYDAIAGCASQFMRTGDRRWWRLMTELAAHVRDIDIYHTDDDRPAYNHGLFWHTAHYVPAGRSSHRGFPRHPRVRGGGPANEHNYTAGLRLHWLMTGESQSRDAVLELAQWVIDMDDGRRTPFKWLSAADTGLASQTHTPGYHGPGRGAAHSIRALLDGHRLSGEQRFLVKAEQLIRRTVHPHDDITRLDLLDAERRWSYVVLLQALGEYLDYKILLGENDARYAYARAALVHYAAWMADYEYPYLDKPEILEYPTETWAAQDLRKADVFAYAAAHCGEKLRPRLLERAAFFVNASFTTLAASKTRTLARPLVLLLSHGYMHMNGCASAPRPAPVQDASVLGPPLRFVPQRTKAGRRLTAAAVVAALLMLAAWSALGPSGGERHAAGPSLEHE